MIRPFKINDIDSLLKILRLNTPKYFAPAEEADFVNYLNEETELYYVVEEDNTIVGSGGVNFTDHGKKARISWDLIHPDYQGKGIGRSLTTYRIELIKKTEAIEHISVRTSQFVYQFYQKLGFYLINKELDYWAKGIDMYEMELPIIKTE